MCLPGFTQKRGWSHRPFCSPRGGLSGFLLHSVRAHTHAHARMHTHTASPHPVHHMANPTQLSGLNYVLTGPFPSPPVVLSQILALHTHNIYHNFNYIYTG